ncbi:hypothetical protein [Parasedimentitalea psychrophila]
MRRLTTRYEKLKRNFLSMVQLFAIRCWINCVQSLTTASTPADRCRITDA